MNLNKFSFISKNKKLNDAIKHLNKNKLPDNFEFIGSISSCYRQI